MIKYGTSSIIIYFYFITLTLSERPPFLFQTTPVSLSDDSIPPASRKIYDCSKANDYDEYQPWPSHFITATPLPMDQLPVENAKAKTNFNSPNTYSVPQQPIQCTSQTQLRNGSCTTYHSCVQTMKGMINLSPHCPPNLYCCLLPTCALTIGTKTRYGHCRPKRTCPGIFDTVLGVSTGCPDYANSPCCVAEEAVVKCPRNYEIYVNALSKSFGQLNTTAAATPQRVLAWAPFLLSAFEPTVGMCVFDCHKTSFLQFIMNVLSEQFMFTNGMNGFYKQLLDWKGVSNNLLPSNAFSYYSPHIFSKAISNIFKVYELEKKFGTRSFLSAYRILHHLNKELPLPLGDNSLQMTRLSWLSYQNFASMLDCKPAIMDGDECGHGRGLCFLKRLPPLMNATEYYSYCPSQIALQVGDCRGYTPNRVCCAKPYPAIKYGAHLVKNEINEVVVAVHQLNYHDPNLISDLVKVLTKASAALYRATGGRAYFRTVTIVSQWNGTHGTATYESYRKADFKVVSDLNNQQPRAVQLGTCGEKGLGVVLSHNHLRQNGAAQTMAKMFALNQWGIGDEVASTFSETTYVPDSQSASGAMFQKGSSCSAKIEVTYMPVLANSKVFKLQLFKRNSASASFAFRPDLMPEANAEFCTTTTRRNCDETRRHNSESNTPHNRICNRTSTLSAILRSSDFDQSQNTPRFVGNTIPAFRFVRYPHIRDVVIAIVADFSHSVTTEINGIMLNALMSFLQIAPDEVKIVLVGLGSNRPIEIQPEPIAPLDPFSQPTGGIFFGRHKLTTRVSKWLRYIKSGYSLKNTSVIAGLDQLVETYLTKPNYRLKILTISNFLAPAPSDNRLLDKIRQGGYSIWPVALWSQKYLSKNQFVTEYPLYDYMQFLANSTNGRWQFLADPNDMTHWYYAFGTFLNDLDLGASILVEKYTVAPGNAIDIKFSVPTNYKLNTSVIVNYDADLHSTVIARVSNGSSDGQNCFEDYRGYQAQFRAGCHFGDITLSQTSTQTINMRFSNVSGRTDKLNVSAWIVARAIEYGPKSRGELLPTKPWLDPWANREATPLDQYVKVETKLTSGTRIVFEKSEKFRFPKVYAIVFSGKSAVLNCTVEYDLYFRDSEQFLQLISAGRMYDDGDGGDDSFANDGVYTALLLSSTRNGSYSVHVRIKSGTNSSCFTKPAAATVGFANNGDLVKQSQPFFTLVSFYQSAGAFDLIIPPNAIGLVPLGLVRLHSCAGSLPNKTSFAKVKLFCNIFPLSVATRNNITVTYYLSINRHIKYLIEHDRYPVNASLTAQPNATLTRQTDGSMTLEIAITLAHPYASYYYAVVWATDGKENYATRSAIQIIQVPPVELNKPINELPRVDDITTPAKPEDAFPSAIAFSCIFFGVLAIGVLITILIVWRRRKGHRKMWALDGNRIFLPSTWPQPVRRLVRRPQRPVDHQQMAAGRCPNRHRQNQLQKTAVDDYYERMKSAQLRRQQRQNAVEIFLPRQPPKSATSNRRNTAERQNENNTKLQAFYTRATDDVNRRY